MPAFDANTLVKLGGVAQSVGDRSSIVGKLIGLEEDNKLPESGSLTWGQSDTETDLAGTKGVDCKLIHGDLWQQIGDDSDEKSNLTTQVLTDHNCTIKDKETYEVQGDQDYTVHGNVNYTIYGSSNYTYVGPQGQTRTSTLTMDYGGAVQTNYNAQDWHWQPHSYQAMGFQFQFAIVNVQLFGVVFQLVAGFPPAPPIPGLGLVPAMPAMNVNLIAGLNLSVDALNLQTTAGIQLDCEPAKITLKALEAKIFGAEADAGGAKVRASGSAGVPPHPPMCSG